MSAEHTKGDIETCGFTNQGVGLASTTDGQVIAWVAQGDDEPDGLAEANAAELARRWNAHEGLVAACKQLDEAAKTKGFTAWAEAMHEATVAVRAALAKAEERGA